MFQSAHLSTIIATVAMTSGIGLAQDASNSVQDEIQLLRGRLARLEQQSAQQQRLTETQAAVLSDAQQRSLLLQTGGVTAGYDKGFFIKSADGNFSFRPGLQFQFRSITNWSEGAQSDGDDDIGSGFEVRRARFRFDGTAFTKDLKYSFVWDTARQGGAVSLLDALVEYKFADDLSVRIGQFKESWTHEKDVSGFRQLAVDRTLVDAVIGGNVTDRVQGVALIYSGNSNPVRGEIALHDGANSKNTDYRDTDGSGNTRPDANYGFGGRFEYKLAGDWAAYRDFTAKDTKQDLFVVGGGFDYTEAGDAGIWRGTLDAQWENTAGWHVFAGGIVALTQTGGSDSQDYGLFAQVGYLIDPSWEVFGRYSGLLLDEEVNDNDVFHEITLGLNYYLGTDGSAFHAAKVTLDFVWLPEGSPSAQTGLGYTGSDDNQFVVRGQFQLAL